LEEFGFGFMISQKAILKTKGNSENRAGFPPSIKGAKKRNAYLEHKQRNTMSDDFFGASQHYTQMRPNDRKKSLNRLEKSSIPAGKEKLQPP
jgi:hypothetical protein